jgi:hypothetical protein
VRTAADVHPVSPLPSLNSGRSKRPPCAGCSCAIPSHIPSGMPDLYRREYRTSRSDCCRTGIHRQQSREILLPFNLLVLLTCLCRA